MAKTIGIDFGTTNSLISVVLEGTGTIKSFLNDKRMPHPSVVSYSGGRIIAGRKAKEQLEDSIEKGANEEIVKSPKTKLGHGPFYIGGRETEPVAVVADLMKYLIDDAASASDSTEADFTKAVVSIPVASDGRMRIELRDALLQAGIHVTQFVHEPLAALYGYLRDQSHSEETLRQLDGKMVLVFDWGGGTLDLTLCLVKDGSLTQILNKGDNEVGGDYVDEAIRSYILERHLKTHSLDRAPQVTPGARASLLHACEKAKIELSVKEKVFIYVPDFYMTDEPSRDIEVELSRKKLEEICSIFIERGLGAITELLDILKIDQRRISLCLATGGMVSMPAIKQRLIQTFSIDRLEVSGKADRIISEGCAWIAHDQLRMSLAKPLEIVEARQSYFTVLDQGTLLPMEGDLINEPFDIYCVDPRDGKAKIRFKRPRYLNKSAQSDPRDEYGNLVIEVDKKGKAFYERITVNFTIDDNFIVMVRAFSALTKKEGFCQFYDLEFSLSLPHGLHGRGGGAGSKTDDVDYPKAHEPQTISIRSNIATREIQALVPGEFLYEYRPRSFDPAFGDATPIQRDEKLYYLRCDFCERLRSDPYCRCISLSGSGQRARVIRTKAHARP